MKKNIFSVIITVLTVVNVVLTAIMFFVMVPTFNKTNNDEILKFYKETLEELGLKGQICLYTKREELKKIDWEKDSEDWLLWIDDHIDAFNNITELLTPMFFAYNNQ